MRDPATVHHSSASDDVGQRPVILVADDYPENRRLLYFYLRDRFDVLQASTAEEAINLLRERERLAQPVLLAILDLNFCDGMSGIDAVQVIRQDPSLAHTKVVALTAYAYPDDRDRCIEAGFDAYLAKPVFKPGLLEQIDELLDARPSGDGAAGEPGAVWISRARGEA